MSSERYILLSLLSGLSARMRMQGNEQQTVLYDGPMFNVKLVEQMAEIMEDPQGALLRLGEIDLPWGKTTLIGDRLTLIVKDLPKDSWATSGDDT